MRIVVDTSVARAAGEGDHTARACLDSLETMVRIKSYTAVFNRSLLKEWFRVLEDKAGKKRTHASSFAVDWFRKMRKKVQVLPGQHQRSRVQVFRERRHFINYCLQASSQLAVSAIEKDLHLVDLALQADQRVLSTDKKIVGHLRRLGARVPEVCPILWVHPVDHDAPAWLAGGAPARDDCRIC